jgi:hypothetical protein
MPRPCPRDPSGRRRFLRRAHLERGVATLRELEVSSRYTIREAASPVAGILEELRAAPYDILVVGAGGSITGRAAPGRLLDPRGSGGIVVRGRYPYGYSSRYDSE